MGRGPSGRVLRMAEVGERRNGERARPTSSWWRAGIAAAVMIVISFVVFVLIPNSLLGYLSTRVDAHGARPGRGRLVDGWRSWLAVSCSCACNGEGGPERVRFTTQSVGAEWFDDNVPCTRACPVLTNAGRYVTAIAAGDDELAYRIARLPNPFPSICGRVCAAPCEQACRRGQIDEPIAIRALKRYVTRALRRRERRGSHSLPRRGARCRPRGHERVAIIGAGPAGMACAHDLATYGYRPVVFEAQDRPGGMMVLGIPPYRLRRDLLQDEIARDPRDGRRAADERAAGPRLHARLAEGRGLRSGVPGRRLHARARPADPGVRAGRGPAGRRLPAEREPRLPRGPRRGRPGDRWRQRGAGRRAHRPSRDRGGPRRRTARSTRPGPRPRRHVRRRAVAKRLGARRVRVVALESREEMPAHEFEIEEAEVEGIEILTRRGPHRIVGTDHVEGLETLDVSSVFDPDGRFNPQFVEGTERSSSATP